MAKTARERVHEIFQTEKRVSDELLGYLRLAGAEIPQEALAKSAKFLVSIIGASITGGIKLYSAGHVLAGKGSSCEDFRVKEADYCVDSKNHVYFFKVLSEKRDRAYLVSFQHLDRGKGHRYFEPANIFPYCQCDWFAYGPSTKGGRLRLCKHQFAAMLWLFFNSDGGTLDKLQKLVKFMALAVFWAHPNLEGRLKRIKKSEREAYLRGYDGIFAALKREYGEIVEREKARTVLEEGLTGELGLVSDRLTAISGERKEEYLQFASIMDSLVEQPSAESFRKLIEEFEEELIFETGELLRAKTSARKRDASLAKYGIAERIRTRAETMEKQLKKLRAVGDGGTIRRVIAVWDKGLALRREEFESLKGGIIPGELLEQSIENRKREIGIVFSCQFFYSDLLGRLSAINMLLKKMTPPQMAEAIKERISE